MASSTSRQAFYLVLLITSIQYFGFGTTISETRLLLHDNINQDQEDLVTKACDQTMYFKLCVSSLRSDPRTNQTSDLKGLAVIALDLSITKANQSLSYAQRLLLFQSSSNYTQYEKECLSDCSQELSEAVENLQDSTQALMNGTLNNVNDFVSSAMTDSQTCDDCFKEEHEGNTSTSPAPAPAPALAADDIDDGISSLAAINQDFNKLCSNFLAITTLLT